ncbi:glutathione S-transferase [Xylogone sp. PMI_703]|nr:glutathione S-transferase [Xylogone sp. PMI_703]
MSKPIVLHGSSTGPNPWKVVILLEELELPYEMKLYDYAELKKEPFLNLNPNGRVPAIEDPNTGIILAESGAIIQYLIEVYDKDNKLHYDTLPEKYAEYQWLHFQMSGQGPYFGQKAWFTMFHEEKLPSAELRYANEIRRVVGVVEYHLEKQKTGYLVGNKVSYADLAWIPWNGFINWLVPDFNVKKEFPKFAEWDEKLRARSAVVKAYEIKDKLGSAK